MKHSVSFKRILGFFFGIGAMALPALAAVSTLATPACYDRGCDQKGIGAPPVTGNLLDANTWESGPMDADWLDFGAGQTWVLDTTALGNRQPSLVTGYISAQKKYVIINADGVPVPRAFTAGGGNPFEVLSANANVVVVHNTTCAQYYARIVVEALGPLPDAGTSLDGGDGGVSDAGVTDAGTD